MSSQSSAGVQEKFFKTLEDLVRHYKKRNQGLANRLRYSVKRKQTDQESVISNDEPDYESERKNPHKQFNLLLQLHFTNTHNRAFLIPVFFSSSLRRGCD